MMADLLDDAVPVPARARSRSMSASVRPAPNAPILRKLRRLRPSQNRCLAPQSVNIGKPPCVGKKELSPMARWYLRPQGGAIEKPAQNGACRRRALWACCGRPDRSVRPVTRTLLSGHQVPNLLEHRRRRDYSAISKEGRLAFDSGRRGGVVRPPSVRNGHRFTTACFQAAPATLIS